MNNTITFEFDRQTYEMSANGRFYCTPLNGKKTRIGKLAFETVYNAYMAKKAARIEEEEDEVETMTEEEFEQKLEQFEEDVMTEKLAEVKAELEEDKVESKETEKSKSKKPRAKKVQVGGMEFDNNGIKVILTPKQVDFIKHLPDTDFWENGVNSSIWIDVLCDDIGGQFAGKPMTVGAMISTLCEKGLGVRTTQRRDGRKCVGFALSELGQKIATELGL